MKKLTAFAFLAFVISASAMTNSMPHVYPSGFRIAMKVGSDLYLALDPKFQKFINPQPISLEDMDAPMITPSEGDEDNKTLRQVKISVGFLDLLNHIAHAKAIDEIQHGYFQQYVALVTRAGANDPIPDLPNSDDERYWTDDVMSSQLSYADQMIGMAVAINLSHLYLGHYMKYSGQMFAGKLTPINNYLTPAEWEAGVRAGALNSLDCAYATEGIKALFEAIDAMPQRPAWASFIAPKNTDLKKLNKQLAKYEDLYFHGGLK